MENKKGFTLIELLAAMVILGIIMAVAVPNVMGILKNSKDKTYVEDAKKFISLAEYKFRSGNGIKKPNKGKMTVISLSYVDNSEFENAPNGNKYDKEKSKVFINNESGTYKYYVVLVEDMGESYRGIYNISYEDLYTKDVSELVNNPSDTIADICKISSSAFNIDRLNTVSGTYQYRYTADSSCSDGSLSDDSYSGVSK